MTPDPEAVRRALREIDRHNEVGAFRLADEATLDHGPVLLDAARAWLAAQDATGEGSE